MGFKKQPSSNTTLDCVSAPLLPAASVPDAQQSCNGLHSKSSPLLGSQQRQQQQHTRPVAVDLGRLFVRRLWRILCIVNAAPAFVLVALALAEAVIVSKIGTISSLFYQVFVDGQSSKVPHLMLWSAGCYAATALFYSIKSALQDLFAWRWRARLTATLQQAYCSSTAARCSTTHSSLMQCVDNPDQRLAQDLPLLTSSLSEVLTQLAAVPFNIAWYTYLTHNVFGSWLPVAAAYLFFLLGVVLQRLAMLPVASWVYHQEAAEGAFRYSHMRFRAATHQVALYRSESCEGHHLEAQLSRVLICQGQLLLRRAVLTASTKLLEYGGLVVNFGCLALAVFSGAWADQQHSAGDLAARVSVASFYLLTLIYNFTQVLDLAIKVSNLAGLTARVSQLLEALTCNSNATTHRGSSIKPSAQRCAQQQQQQQQQGCWTYPSNNKLRHQQGGQGSSSRSAATAEAGSHLGSAVVHHLPGYHQQQQQQPLVMLGDGAAPSHKRYASQAVMLQPPQLMIVRTTSGLTQAAGLSSLAAWDDDRDDSNSTRSSSSSSNKNEMQQDAFSSMSMSGSVQQQQQQQQQEEGVQPCRGTAAVSHDDAGANTGAAPTSTDDGNNNAVTGSGGGNMSHPVPGMTNPISLGLSHPEVMQVSVHSLGSDMLLQEVRRAFPDCPRLAPLLAVVTFQFCGPARHVMRHKLQQQQQHQQQQEQQSPSSMRYSSGGLKSSSSSSGGGGGHGGTSSSAAAAGQADAPDCCPGCAAAGSSDGCSSTAANAAGGGGCADAAGGGGCMSGLCDGPEMQHMLEVFLSWQQAVSQHINSRGYWCGTIDPRTGRALEGTAGSSYDEVIGASVLLGYSKHQPAGQLPLISHPEAHTHVYPATLFTTAPLPVLREALRATTAAAAVPQGEPGVAPVPAGSSSSSSTVAAASGTLIGFSAPAGSHSLAADASNSSSSSNTLCYGSSSSNAATTSSISSPYKSAAAASAAAAAGVPPVLLSCSNLTVSTPSGVLVVRGLDMGLVLGSCLLIQGPSGCGKSTLLSCLAGLWPADTGRFSIVTSAAAIAAQQPVLISSCGTAAATAGGLWDATGGQDGSKSAAVSAAAASGLAVMFVPQRPLAAPGTTLREQLVYPAAAWPCLCCASGCSADMDASRQQQPQHLHGSVCLRQQQRQQRQAAAPTSSSSVGWRDWWLDWLSCGLHMKQLKHQYQSVPSFRAPLPVTAAAGGTASAGTSGWAAQVPPQVSAQQQEQQQVCGCCQQLLTVLDSVGLSYLLTALPHGLNSCADDWSSVLSPGELQRLTFARILLHKPLLAVLDEATSSLPDAAAIGLYQLLQQAGISYVSVAHSSSLMTMHQQVLHLDGDGRGSWRLGGGGADVPGSQRACTS